VQIYLDINSTPEQEAVLREKLHRDQPLVVQFALFLGDVLRGDFGQSLQFAGPAMPVVLERLGPTAQLVAVALVIALLGGAAAGIVCAIWKDRVPDFALSSIAIGQSMSSFWLGTLLI